jgi:hypothetical protein
MAAEILDPGEIIRPQRRNGWKANIAVERSLRR